MKHCLTLSELSISEVMQILKQAKECSNGTFEESETGRIVANLFFEPSTRTQYSFQVAEQRLGCKFVNFNPDASSLKKGESVYDTIKTFESFGVDALVIRSEQDEYYKELLPHIQIPIINAGDGTMDHPTQTLLDLYTIMEEFQRFEGLKIAVVGDILHSRVANSNIEMMQRLGMDVYTSGPKELQNENYNYLPFEEAVSTMDILMMLRIQHERHEDLFSTKHYLDEFGLTKSRVEQMKDTAIIMHPGPFNRNVEIADDVAECSKSRIHQQVKNGVYIRMAILKRALEETTCHI